MTTKETIITNDVADDLVDFGVRLAHYDELCQEINDIGKESDSQTIRLQELKDGLNKVVKDYPDLSILRQCLEDLNIFRGEGVRS